MAFENYFYVFSMSKTVEHRLAYPDFSGVIPFNGKNFVYQS